MGEEQEQEQEDDRVHRDVCVHGAFCDSCVLCDDLCGVYDGDHDDRKVVEEVGERRDHHEAERIVGKRLQNHLCGMAQNHQKIPSNHSCVASIHCIVQDVLKHKAHDFHNPN